MAFEISRWKIWPHYTLVAVICAVAAGVAVGWWVKHENAASAEAIPNAARIQRVEGEVVLNNAATTSNDPNWIEATANQPFSVGDQILTRDNAHASVAFTGRNFARLGPNTSLDVLSLADRRTQLAIRDGSAAFDVGYLAPGELFEVATPYGAVELQQPGLYNVGFDNGDVLVSVLSGLAQVVGLGGTGQISKGEVLRLVGQTAADVVLSRLNGDDAGYFVDDYYNYQYPNYYDGRYRDYNVYLQDPYYFDPYRRTTSYQYVNSYYPGLNDLDYYGTWQNLNGYGYSWTPRVDAGWAPYQQGYWMNDYPYGPTWVSQEPWGYAPYHYGRWAYVGNQWYWVPDRNSNPVYSPGLVAFVPFSQSEVGWLPLGPNDPYAARYYDDQWQPYYLNRDHYINSQLANWYVPGAVTVVPFDDFGQRVDWRRARKADRHMLTNVNPVLDPLLYTPLRNAVVHSAWGRGKKDIPPGIAKKLRETTVYTSSAPVVPAFRRHAVRDWRVEPITDRGNRKFKDERGDNRGVIQSARDDRSNNGRGREKMDNRRDQQIIARPEVGAKPGRGNQGAQGERVGNKGRGGSYAMPREQGVEKKRTPLVPRSQQPLPIQRQDNPGRAKHSQQSVPVQRQANPVRAKSSQQSVPVQRQANPGRAKSSQQSVPVQRQAHPGRGAQRSVQSAPVQKQQNPGHGAAKKPDRPSAPAPPAQGGANKGGGKGKGKKP